MFNYSAIYIQFFVDGPQSFQVMGFSKRPNRMFQLNEPETLTEINLRGKGVQKAKVYSQVQKGISDGTWS